MSKLSPAAQVVWSAYEEILENECVVTTTDRRALASALRAAADQVVPPALEEEFFDRNHALPPQKVVAIRLQLLAIAAELEGQ